MFLAAPNKKVVILLFSISVVITAKKVRVCVLALPSIRDHLAFIDPTPGGQHIHTHERYKIRHHDCKNSKNVAAPPARAPWQAPVPPMASA